jgi:hypothetical protein
MDRGVSLDRINETLERIGIHQAEIKQARPSLEDVFVTLTKRAQAVNGQNGDGDV